MKQVSWKWARSSALRRLEDRWHPCRGAIPHYTGDPVVSLRSTTGYWLGSHRLPGLTPGKAFGFRLDPASRLPRGYSKMTLESPHDVVGRGSAEPPGRNPFHERPRCLMAQPAKRAIASMPEKI